MSKKSGKIKRITALLLTAVFLTASIHLDTTAAESTVPGNTKENPAVTEIQEGAPSATAEKKHQKKLQSKTKENETSGESLTETAEDKIPEESPAETAEDKTTDQPQAETTNDKMPGQSQTETIDNGTKDQSQAETTDDKIPDQSQTETTDDRTPDQPQTETTDDGMTDQPQTETADDSMTDQPQTETANDKTTDQLQAETADDKILEEPSAETTDDKMSEETLTEITDEMPENPLENTVDGERKFALRDGDTDITSGKFGAVLARMTLPEEPDSNNSEAYIKTLNPIITGANGNANAYFKNLRIVAEDKEENAATQYRLTGDVKAEAPTVTYTVTMTAGGKSDTATFAVAEKGIESLKIKGIPSVISSEKKVNIRPALEINEDPTGKEQATTPKNKKITWEIISTEGMTAPSSLKINRQNGAITVNAADHGAFRVKATTADSRYTDAEGNPISVTSEIVEVVSENDQRLESLAGCTIVLVDNPAPAKAQLLHQNGKSADMSRLDGTKAYIKIQKADGSFVSPENYVIKANNKAFRIGADASAACVLTKPIAPGKMLTVTLTATLVNGKKEQPLKGRITIQSAASGEQDLSLALDVSGTGRSELKNDGKTLEFSGSASTLIKIKLMKNGSPAKSPASYRLAFKNLKKMSEVISKDGILVYATLRKASGTVVLTDCSTGKVTAYEVRNVEKAAVTGKSPAIRQRTTPASSTGPDYIITARGKAVTDFTHVRVELLPSDYIKSCKTRSAQGKYRAFASALGLNPYGSDQAFKVYEVQSEDHTFRIPFVKAEQPAKGSYKLQMTVGKMDGRQFVATAAPVVVATKVSGRPVKPETDTEGGKVLVAYFSATNTTEGVAKKLADGIDAELYEIVPAVPYTGADLNYNNPDSRANREMNDPNARPAISGSVENMGQYDIVFIGYPIWWGQAPKILYTFMESYDFSGKTIVPFCTSGSSGIGSSATNLEPLTNGATWLPGRRFSGSVSQNTIMEWVLGLGLNLEE